jgi:NAD+ synthase (glutamine-hydrolysing)
MKIAIAQLNYHIGNFAENTKKIIDAIKKAKQQKADLIVFAELAICGYPPRDFLEFDDFISLCDNAVSDITNETKEIAVIIGSVYKNPNKEGKRLYNAAYFIYEGKVQAIAKKSLLPTYDVFDEYRYFEPAKDFSVIQYKNKKIALTICEDLWDIEERERLYTIRPMDELIKQKPDFMVNIAASPFHSTQGQKRKEILQKNAKHYQLPLIYVNHVGAQTEILFDGNSLFMNQRGELVQELALFQEDFSIIDLENKEQVQQTNPEYAEIELIYNALIMGLQNYFHKLGFSKAILGLSGGIDSAVTLAIAEKALGKENLLAVLLPSPYSSQHSIDDAIQLAENLGVEYQIIPIEKAFAEVQNSLHPVFKDAPFDLTEENIQARLRGLILMALSNKYGYILLNTSNKSEAAVGYGTLYGDMCGGISVIGDVYKTAVYSLAKFINREKEIIPINSITKPPSAELRPEQKDSDSLPDYDILDSILFLYIEERKSPAEIIKMGYEKPLVEKILRLVNISEYKRFQSPPVLRVSKKAFGMGRRMPIVAKYLS